MRANVKLFSVVLCALFVLGFTLTATAQVSHNVTAANTQLVYKGMREVLGGVSLTATTVTTTQGGSIYITYSVPFTNGALGAAGTPVATANGISITYANGMVLSLREPTGAKVGGYVSGGAAWKISSATNINGGTQAQIVIGVPAALVVAQQDQISLDGIRADVSALAINSNVTALLSSIPSQANTYNPANIIVATVQPNFTLTNVVPGTGVVCENTVSSDASLTITEGFAGAFVQHTGIAGYPITANSRPAYGGNANTEFIITVGALPAGVELSWPTLVNNNEELAAGAMSLISVSSDSTVATYQFVTLDQALSDQNVESFTFDVNIILSGTASPGDSNVQVQMAPLSTSSAVPKFKSQILNSPADLFISINRCVTYLLFPYVAHGFGGFDTGLAIANTSFDSTVFGSLGANPQDGDLTVYYFKQFASGGTAPDPLAYDAGANDLSSGVLEAGNTWINTLSGMNGKVAGFADSYGYIIAKCQFQNAHGYAYVAFQLTGPNGVAQSYVANVILDPQTVGPRWWTTSHAGGEGLNN